MSKFCKSEKVKFIPNMKVFGSSLKGTSEITTIVEVKECPDGTQYRIKNHIGFYPEDFFEKIGE